MKLLLKKGIFNLFIVAFALRCQVPGGPERSWCNQNERKIVLAGTSTYVTNQSDIMASVEKFRLTSNKIASMIDNNSLNEWAII